MSIKLPSLEQLIDSFLMCCMTEGKSQKTIDFYSHNLLRFCRFLKAQKLSTLLDEIGVAEARKFIFYLQNNAIRWEDNPRITDDKHLSPFSVQGYVRAIKAFWTWLFNEGRQGYIDFCFGMKHDFHQPKHYNKMVEKRGLH